MSLPSLRSLRKAGEGPPEVVKHGPSPPPRCRTCGRALSYAPVTRWLLESVLGFCSGRCASEFDRLFPETVVAVEPRRVVFEARGEA